MRWGGTDVLVTCVVCGTESTGPVVATVLHPTLGEVRARRCIPCGSLRLLDEPLAYADEDSLIDSYVEVAAGLGPMLETLSVVDPNRVRTFLDVGCGYGFTVDMTTRLWNWESVGVEPELSGRRGAAELGITVLENIPRGPTGSSRGFDLVYSSEVLEHVPEPLGFLRAVRAALAPGGVLLLTTPAAESVDPSWPRPEMLAAISAGHHVFLASESGLERLMRRAGFDDVLVTRIGMTLYAAAGDLDLLVAGAGGLVPNRGVGLELLHRYLEARRPQRGDASALASGLTTRRLRGLVARGDWANVPEALDEATDVLLRRSGVSLADPDDLRLRISTGAVSPPLTLVPIAFSAGMWALFDSRPAEAHALLLLCAVAAGRVVADGHRMLETIDLEFQARFHAALAATSFDPIEAVRLAGALEDPDGSHRCRVFTSLVVAGHTSTATELVSGVAAVVDALSRSDDSGLARTGADAQYALGIHALAQRNPIAALEWFERCRESALRGSAGDTTDLVAVAEEHVRIARESIPASSRGRRTRRWPIRKSFSFVWARRSFPDDGARDHSEVPT